MRDRIKTIELLEQTSISRSRLQRLIDAAKIRRPVSDASGHFWFEADASAEVREALKIDRRREKRSRRKLAKA